MLLLTLFIGTVFCDLSAQKEFNIEQITSINLGDGRYLFRTLKDEKLLDGEHRIIDGYHSEYRFV
jgi:hypothetical protein